MTQEPKTEGEQANPQAELRYILPHPGLPDEEELREFDLQSLLDTDVQNSVSQEDFEAIINWLDFLIQNQPSESESLEELSGSKILLRYNPLWNFSGLHMREIIEGLDSELDYLEVLDALNREYNPDVNPEILSNLVQIEQIYISMVLMMFRPELRDLALPLNQNQIVSTLGELARESASYYLPYTMGAVVLTVEPFDVSTLVEQPLPGIQYPLTGLNISVRTATEEEVQGYTEICEARGVTFEANSMTYMNYSVKAMQHRWGIQLDDAYLSGQGVTGENAFVCWKDSPHESRGFEVVLIDKESKRNIRTFIYETVRNDDRTQTTNELVAQTVSEYGDGPPFGDRKEPSHIWREWIYKRDEYAGWQPVKCFVRNVLLGGVDIMVVSKISHETGFDAVADGLGNVLFMLESTFQMFDGENTIAVAFRQGEYMVPINIRTPATGFGSDEILRSWRPMALMPAEFTY